MKKRRAFMEGQASAPGHLHSEGAAGVVRICSGQGVGGGSPSNYIPAQGRGT